MPEPKVSPNGPAFSPTVSRANRPCGINRALTPLQATFLITDISIGMVAARKTGRYPVNGPAQTP